MRRAVLCLHLAVGCDGAAADADDPAARRIEFLVETTEDPLPAGSTLEITLRPQGVFGAAVGLRIFGVAPDEQERFAVRVRAPAGHLLADQPYLPTSTARELDDGSIVIDGVHVVFFDTVADAEVEGAPGTLSAEMQTSPPATGELDVILERLD
jgi:hypothetical protein